MGMSNAANTKTIAQVMWANAPNLDLISLSSLVMNFGRLTVNRRFQVQPSLHFQTDRVPTDAKRRFGVRLKSRHRSQHNALGLTNSVTRWVSCKPTSLEIAKAVFLKT